MDGPGVGSVVERILEHHGVKGQKWGVRRDRGHEGQRATNRKIAKLDRKFERKTRQPFHQDSMQTKFHNQAADAMNGPSGHIAKINNKPIYKKGVDSGQFLRDTPLRRKYDQEMKDAYFGELEKAARSVGTNASGTQRYTIVEDRGGNWQVGVTDVAHASGAPFFLVNVIRDDRGWITKIEIPPNGDMSQDDLDTLAANALKHFGVKGMHWGVRRSASKGKSSVDAKRTDAIRAKIKTHGPKSVSNKQLKDLLNRIEMEQKLSKAKANSSSLKKGHETAKEIVAIAGTASAIFALAHSPLGKAVRSQLGNIAKAAKAARAAGKVAKVGTALVVGG